MNRELLKALNERPISYYPIYKEIMNSTAGGVVLSQLMYWFTKKDKFYKTDKDIIAETRIGEGELKSAKKQLKALTFIEITREGVPAKTYYKIDWELYQTSLVNLTKLDKQELLSSVSNINQTITKTTTKKEREGNFYEDNKNSISMYIKHLEKSSDIRNKEAHKSKIIKKFIAEDKPTIEVFEDWRLDINMKNILLSANGKTYNLKVENKTDKYFLKEVTANNFNIVLLFEGTDTTKGIFQLRNIVENITEAVNFLSRKVCKEVNKDEV